MAFPLCKPGNAGRGGLVAMRSAAYCSLGSVREHWLLGKIMIIFWKFAGHFPPLVHALGSLPANREVANPTWQTRA